MPAIEIVLGGLMGLLMVAVPTVMLLRKERRDLLLLHEKRQGVYPPDPTMVPYCDPGEEEYVRSAEYCISHGIAPVGLRNAALDRATQNYAKAYFDKGEREARETNESE